MNRKIIHGKHLIISADRTIADGAVYIEKDVIMDTGSYEEIKKKYPCDCEIGSDQHIVLPGFINAHSHGKGVTDFQRGQIDDTLETWKFRNYPFIDVGLDTLWCGIKQLEAGITTTMHNHNLIDSVHYMDEFTRAADAYETCRLKVAFAPSLVNRNWFVYGDNDAFIRNLPPELQKVCRTIIANSQRFGPEEYFRTVGDLSAHYRDSPWIKIIHGPVSPQWVDVDSLKSIKQEADLNGRQIHIHVQQTKLQNLYGYKFYGTSLLGFLDSIGFLGSNVTVGHAVWISKKDIELLALRGVKTTHHAGCNLRVRNGISPVYELLKAGVSVGIGLDDKELGDDKDYLEEMRLISKLHRLPDHRLDSPHLQPRDVLRMAFAGGAEALGWSGRVGSLEKGKQADLVLLNARRITEPFVSPTLSVRDLVLYRAGARDIDMVLVDGEVVVKNGRVIHLDRDEVLRTIREALPKDYGTKLEKKQPAPAETTALYCRVV